MTSLEEMWDVIIVGGGPAGSGAAITLARSNRRVLLIEKEKLPRHKVCSGLISEGGGQRILKQEFNLDLPEVVCTRPKIGKGSKLTLKLGSEPQFLPDRFYIIWRRDFDYWLLIEANKDGAEVRDETELTSLTEKEGVIEVKVKTKNETTGVNEQIILKSKYLIGADGVASKVKRILFPEAKIHTGAILQGYWEGTINLDPHYFYTFMEPSLWGGDAWYNYKEGQLIIGVGAEKGGDIRKFQSNFIRYLEEAHGLRLGRKIREEGCLAPSNFSSFPGSMQYLLGKGNCLLVGDVADLQDVMGEGIPTALKSGKKAANAILEHLRKPEGASVEIYQDSMKNLVTRLKSNWQGYFNQLKSST